MTPNRGPRLLAVIFSAVAIALAIVPRFVNIPRYDPTLAVLTATLVAIIWYTFFTYESVALSRELATQAVERAASSLSILCRRLRRILGGLPQAGDERDMDQRLRTSELWTETDLGDLSRLAGERGSEMAEHASRVVSALRWMHPQIAGVRRTKPEHGYPWGRFPWPEWVERIEEAKTALDALLRAE